MQTPDTKNLWEAYKSSKILQEKTLEQATDAADTRPKDGKISKHEKKIADNIMKNNDDESDDEHVCAIEVEHQLFGRGKCVFAEHAQPDDNGYVSWYTVAFEHGNEVVNTRDLNVLSESSHGNH